jgi:hypothetical protein
VGLCVCVCVYVCLLVCVYVCARARVQDMLERERLAAGVPLLKALLDFDRFRVTEVSGFPCTRQQLKSYRPFIF